VIANGPLVNAHDQATYYRDLPMALTMTSPAHRLPVEGFIQSVDWLCEHYRVDNRMGTLLLWDCAFKVGTDRHYWIIDSRAHKFIEENRELHLR